MFSGQMAPIRLTAELPQSEMSVERYQCVVNVRGERRNRVNDCNKRLVRFRDIGWWLPRPRTASISVESKTKLSCDCSRNDFIFCHRGYQADKAWSCALRPLCKVSMKDVTCCQVSKSLLHSSCHVSPSVVADDCLAMRTRMIASDTTGHEESERKKSDELSCHSHCYRRPPQPCRKPDERYVRDYQRIRQQDGREELTSAWIARDLLGNHT